MHQYKPLLYIALAVLTMLLTTSRINAETSFDLETGITFNTINDVRIPGDIGTDFSLTEDFQTNASPFIRLKFIQSLGERHTISVLYAPLIVKSTGNLDHSIDFAGVTFPSNMDIDGTYKFNSYRLSYRYDFTKNDKNEIGVGLTAKIRDAKIELAGGGITAKKANVGFVPIINFRFKHKINETLSFFLDGDALAAPQGRAEDVLLALTYKLNESVALKGGYRILEGGADNDEVYGFALFHYALIGMTVRLR